MLEPEGERWLTYAEVGDLLGISPAAARMLAKRRGWPRRTPNAFGDRARVLVPNDVAVQPRSASYAERAAHVIASDQEGVNGHDQANIRVFEQAITALQEQLTIANCRAERAEQRIDELQAALADAVAVERRLADKDVTIDYLRHQLETLMTLLTAHRPWWLRWFR